MCKGKEDDAVFSESVSKVVLMQFLTLFQNLVSELVGLHHLYIEANLCYIEAASDVRTLEERVARFRREIAEKEAIQKIRKRFETSDITCLCRCLIIL